MFRRRWLYATRAGRSAFRGTRTPVVTVRGSARRLLLVAVAAAMLCAGLYAGSVLTPAGQFLAEMVLYGRPLGDAETLRIAGETLGTISVAMVAGATIGIAAVAFALGRPRLALGVIVAVGGATLTTQLLKRELLDRPNLIGRGAFAFGNSFPSGHVTVAASIVLVTLLVVPRGLRAPVALAGALYVAAVGMASVAAGWHRLGDALGGILIALAWVSLVAAVLALTSSAMPRRSWRFGSGRQAIVVLGIGGLLAGIAGAAVLGAAWFDPARSTVSPAAVVDAPRAFAGALAVIAGAALAACGVLLWAMRGIELDPRRRNG